MSWYASQYGGFLSFVYTDLNRDEVKPLIFVTFNTTGVHFTVECLLPFATMQREKQQPERNKIHKNEALYRESQINVQGQDIFEVVMYIKAGKCGGCLPGRSLLSPICCEVQMKERKLMEKDTLDH